MLAAPPLSTELKVYEVGEGDVDILEDVEKLKDGAGLL